MDDTPGSSGTPPRMNASGIYYFAASETFDVTAYQNSGGALNLLSDAERITSMSVARIR